MKEKRAGFVRRFTTRILLLLLLALVVFYVRTCLGIRSQAVTDEARHADAIVVLGAAEYRGRPSPVLRARLDHGLELYERGIAPYVITTGGSADDPRFSEGGVGHDYLLAHGIPDSQLIAETQGGDTDTSARRVAVILHANNLHSCVAVSDAYHLYRVKRLLSMQGIETYTSPREGSIPRTKAARFWAIQREAFSYLLWSLHIR